MSELTITAIRIGVLVLLWAFVFSVVSVLRGDLYGTRVITRRASGGRPAPAAYDADPAPRTPRAPRRGATHLVVTQGSLAGTEIPLSQAGLLIGRNPECALVLTDDYASGRHAQVYTTGDAWYVDDLGSTNGTYVNGHRIGEGSRLEIGSQIRIGQTVLELRR